MLHNLRDDLGESLPGRIFAAGRYLLMLPFALLILGVAAGAANGAGLLRLSWGVITAIPRLLLGGVLITRLLALSGLNRLLYGTGGLS